MRNFYRSWRYLKPYRGRIGVAVACVLLIAGLWGGGLGLVLPGSKILLSREGLHGWAYKSLAEDHLGASLFEQEASGQRLDGKELGSVLAAASVKKDKPAWQQGVRSGDWLVGVDGEPLRSGPLMKRLSQIAPGRTAQLMVYRNGRLVQPGPTVTMDKESFGAGILKEVVALVPEPRTGYDRFCIFAGLLVLMLVMTLLRGVLTFIQEYLVGTAVWLGIMDLRCENYNVVLHLPTTFFSEKGVSDATSRFIQDTNELARGQNTLFGKTMVEPAKAAASFAIALWGSWELTLLVLLAGPPAFLLIRRLGKKMHKASKRALESWSLLLAVLTETLLGVRVVKAYTMEGAERRRFFRVNRQLLKQQMRKERLDAMTGPLVESLGIVAGMVAAGVAGYLVFVGYRWGGQLHVMDESRFLMWMGALFAMFDPVRKLAKVSMRFQESEAAAKRIFELQDTAVEPIVHGAPTLGRHRQSIEFRHVSYRYPNAAVEAVRDVSLLIRAGQSVAFVGANGSGKTTLLSLLPRLLEPSAGAIHVDGQDIAGVSVRSLRRQIGLVTQDTVIFHASIAENISYGLRRPRREAVLAAAKKAFVDEFVQELPAGYDTMVGEHGSTLSGGQKQRIAIARAILRDPAILIFDEALSQVDPDSERKIHQTLAEFAKGRTLLLIAHRLQTVLAADTVVLLDAGRIVGTGTHEQLLERSDLYRLLFQTQFTGGRSEKQVSSP